MSDCDTCNFGGKAGKCCYKCRSTGSQSLWSRCFGRAAPVAFFLLLSCYLTAYLQGVLFRPVLTQGTPVSNGSTPFYRKGVGIVLLGLGPFARQMKCEAAIESLRTYGGWRGPIHLITDAPACFHHSRWDSCGLNATVVQVEQDLSRGFTLPSLSKTKGNRLRSKAYKMQIFDYVKDPSIDVLLFMDCDILIGQKDGLRDFIDEYAFSGWNETSPIKFFPEDGAAHSGIILAHRTWSKDVLQRWKEQVLSWEDAADQTALVKSNISYSLFNEEKYLFRPVCSYYDCIHGATLTFNHIHNSLCVAHGASMIDTFVHRWSLCSTQGLQYCTPIYMTPWSYSWLPYSSCRKLELGFFQSWPTRRMLRMR